MPAKGQSLSPEARKKLSAALTGRPSPKKGMPLSKAPVDERFWVRVDRDGPIQPHVPELGPCWPWKGRRVNDYGDFQDGKYGKRMRTHRWAWKLSYGDIPEGLWVLHKCDFKPCCRPDHLFLGTPLDNNRDMFSKGRGNPGPGCTANQEGFLNQKAKLTVEQVGEIRRSPETADVLAKHLGVRKIAVLYARNGITYSNVPEERIRYLGVRETARILGVSEYILRTWVNSGRLEAFRVGKRGWLRFSEEYVRSKVSQL